MLGTGDIGSSFARRAKAFEPKSIVGVCRSGKLAGAAQLLGRASDAERFEKLAGEIRKAILHEYFSPAGRPRTHCSVRSFRRMSRRIYRIFYP